MHFGRVENRLHVAIQAAHRLPYNRPVDRNRARLPVSDRSELFVFGPAGRRNGRIIDFAVISPFVNAHFLRDEITIGCKAFVTNLRLCKAGQSKPPPDGRERPP